MPIPKRSLSSVEAHQSGGRYLKIDNKKHLIVFPWLVRFLDTESFASLRLASKQIAKLCSDEVRIHMRQLFNYPNSFPIRTLWFDLEIAACVDWLRGRVFGRIKETFPPELLGKKGCASVSFYCRFRGVEVVVSIWKNFHVARTYNYQTRKDDLRLCEGKDLKEVGYVWQSVDDDDDADYIDEDLVTIHSLDYNSPVTTLLSRIHPYI